MARIAKFPILALFSASFCFPIDKVGSLFIGMDYLPNNEYNETAAGVYKLQKPGFAVGAFVPLNLPYVDAHFKVKASTHRIEKRAWDWSGLIHKDESSLYDKHASALNEILFGKEVRTGNSVTILPQLGLGFQLDALNQDGDSPVGGIVYSDLFTDFSSRFRYRFKRFGFEAIVNYQLCLIPSWSGYEATDRLAFSLGIFK
ncbi:MAG: hypothetical protein ABI036_04660 [Fibrobacteria bacterium]